MRRFGRQILVLVRFSKLLNWNILCIITMPKPSMALHCPHCNKPLPILVCAIIFSRHGKAFPNFKQAMPFFDQFCEAANRSRSHPAHMRTSGTALKCRRWSLTEGARTLEPVLDKCNRSSAMQLVVR
jgi:hypothetical protein